MIKRTTPREYGNDPQKPPERNLVVAVLVRAIRDLVELSAGERNEDKQYLRREVRLWMSSARSNAYSFIWCCKIIGLDPDRTREAIYRVQKDPHLLDNLTMKFGRTIAHSHQRLAA